MALAPCAKSRSTVRYAEADYTVAWVCALPVPEWQASRLMFDELHEELDIGIRAQYQYVYGKINRHNVVMGCLPTGLIGLSSSASVMAEMTSIFPNLQFALLVGVAGGVWSEKHDVRLGDVVVSQPSRQPAHGGVRQYDLGKALPGQSLQLTDWLNMPSPVLLSGLGKLQSAPASESSFRRYLRELTQCMDEVTQERLFPRPESADVLYEPAQQRPEPDFKHATATRRALPRPPRRHDRPLVHYGLIASGNQVLKDASQRDRIVERLGDVLAFEMEAAGIVNQKISCLVIRGICDYCDEHKNKMWQPYSAAAAAAWAKDLLRNIVPWQPSQAPPRTQKQLVLRDDKMSKVGSRQTEDTDAASDVAHEKIISHMSNHDPEIMLDGILARRFEDSLLWVRDHVKWLVDNARSSSEQTLLKLNGKVGSGKTFAMSMLVDGCRLEARSGLALIHHISPLVPLRPVDIFSSLAKQLLQIMHERGLHCSFDVINRLKLAFGDENRRPDLHVLLRYIMRPVIDDLSPVIVFFDGIDEYDEEEQRTIFDGLLALKTSLVFSSRSGRALGHEHSFLCREVNIDGGSNAKDISSLVDERLGQLSSRGDIFADHSLRIKMKEELLKRADGMFLWVYLQLELIRYCRSSTKAFALIEDLPDKLEQVFHRCLSQRQGGRPVCERDLLNLIVAVSQPLNVTELNEILGLRSTSADTDRSLTSILQACCSLVVAQQGLLVPVHSSVRKFLFPNAPHTREVGSSSTAHVQDNIVLDLASLSLQHIWQHLQKSTRAQQAVAVSAKLDIPSLLPHTIQWLWAWLTDTAAVPHRLTVSTVPRTATSVAPAFLVYSLRSWIDHTRQLRPAHSSHDLFRKIATMPEVARIVYPWMEEVSQHTTSDAHLRELLGYAVVNNHLPLLKLIIGPPQLLPSQAFQDAVRSNGLLKPLELAVAAGHLSITTELLTFCIKHGQIALDTFGNATVLRLAIAAGHAKIVDLFQARGLAHMSSPAGVSFLCCAIGTERKEMVKHLVRQGVPLSSDDRNKLDILPEINALAAALCTGNEELTKYILSLCIEQEVQAPVRRFTSDSGGARTYNARPTTLFCHGYLSAKSYEAVLRRAGLHEVKGPNTIGQAMRWAAARGEPDYLQQLCEASKGERWLLRDCFAWELFEDLGRPYRASLMVTTSGMITQYAILAHEAWAYLLVFAVRQRDALGVQEVLEAYIPPNGADCAKFDDWVYGHQIALQVARELDLQDIEQMLDLSRDHRDILSRNCGLVLRQSEGVSRPVELEHSCSIHDPVELDHALYETRIARTWPTLMS